MSEQVICVDGSPPRNRGADPVVKGSIYTVRGHFMDINGERGVWLYEVQGNLSASDGTEIGYRATRFAPIKDENLEIFRAMDRKIFDKKKVDA